MSEAEELIQALERIDAENRRVDGDGFWSPPGWQAWSPGDVLSARRNLSQLCQVDSPRAAG